MVPRAGASRVFMYMAILVEQTAKEVGFTESSSPTKESIPSVGTESTSTRSSMLKGPVGVLAIVVEIVACTLVVGIAMGMVVAGADASDEEGRLAEVVILLESIGRGPEGVALTATDVIVGIAVGMTVNTGTDGILAEVVILLESIGGGPEGVALTATGVELSILAFFDIWSAESLRRLDVEAEAEAPVEDSIFTDTPCRLCEAQFG